jgi:hypothetical protein
MGVNNNVNVGNINFLNNGTTGASNSTGTSATQGSSDLDYLNNALNGLSGSTFDTSTTSYSTNTTTPSTASTATTAATGNGTVLDPAFSSMQLSYSSLGIPTAPNSNSPNSLGNVDRSFQENSSEINAIAGLQGKTDTGSVNDAIDESGMQDYLTSQGLPADFNRADIRAILFGVQNAMQHEDSGFDPNDLTSPKSLAAIGMEAAKCDGANSAIVTNPTAIATVLAAQSGQLSGLASSIGTSGTTGTTGTTGITGTSGNVIGSTYSDSYSLTPEQEQLAYDAFNSPDMDSIRSNVNVFNVEDTIAAVGVLQQSGTPVTAANVQSVMQNGLLTGDMVPSEAEVGTMLTALNDASQGSFLPNPVSPQPISPSPIYPGPITPITGPIGRLPIGPVGPEPFRPRIPVTDPIEYPMTETASAASVGATSGGGSLTNSLDMISVLNNATTEMQRDISTQMALAGADKA